MPATSKSVATFLCFALLLAKAVPVSAQGSYFSGATDVDQSLHKLNELGTVLMIAAHPDDERTSVLAYFARGRHMRTAYLSLTRGEGGQNLIGSEQGAALGIIRTEELLDARRIDGAEQFFTRAIDFGFSKTAAETLAKWGHDRILADVVWVVRSFRPDVIVLVFTGTPLDGHGHHQASSLLGKEAFTAAADPKQFPAQLQYVQPWKARRLVFSTWGGRGNLPKLPSAGAVPTGAFNPILGYSYEELAVLSRSMHHSQGTGAMRRPGGGETQFDLEAGEPTSKDPFDGIDTSWNRLPGGAAVGQILAEAIRTYEPAHPDKIVPLLVKARAIVASIADPLAKIKLKELDETIASCIGLWVEAQAHQPGAIPGGSLSVTTTIMNRSAIPVDVAGAAMEGLWNTPLAVKPSRLGSNQSVVSEFKDTVPAAQSYSQPYWLAKPPANDVYTVDDQRLVGLAESPPLAQVRVRLSVSGTAFELVRPVHYRYADTSQGERERPLEVVPAVAVNLAERVAMFPTAAPRTVNVAVQANVADAEGELRLDLPTGWKADPRSRRFQIGDAGEQQEMAFELTPPAESATASLRVVATVAGREIALGEQVIAYPHIPTQTFFSPSILKLVRADIRVTAHKIGYITGAGDEMPAALRQLGLDVTLLGPSDLSQSELSRFDAVVAGVRAYNVRGDLKANHSRLMRYVHNGGTYVVQYQAGESGFPGGTSPMHPMNIGPYPITIPTGNGYRVTVEEAPVQFPHPDSPLLQMPNRIAESDFAGWVQERGLNFATEWDQHCQTVISSHDPGEKPLAGGELWTRYGKGVYVFTAYSWFRQLPAGVPGAYRMFANLLSAK